MAFSSDQEVTSLSSSNLASLGLGVGKVTPTSRVYFLTPVTISKLPEGKDRFIWEQTRSLAGRLKVRGDSLLITQRYAAWCGEEEGKKADTGLIFNFLATTEQEI